MSSVRKLYAEESGMTMGLVVIMIVLIGVMGAGLLTFVQQDLGSVVQENQGQRAFEMADAGIQAAKKQMVADNIPTHYDGDAALLSESRWSKFYSPGGGAENGMTLKDLDGSASTSDSTNVQIEYKVAGTLATTDAFVVVSTGRYGDAKRKIEAIFTRTSGTQIPPAYYTRSNLFMNGNVSGSAVSFFANGNADLSGNSISLGTSADQAFKKWALATPASDSYENAYNGKPRGTALAGIGVWGRFTGSGADATAIGRGTGRSYDSATNPATVQNYQTSCPATSPALCTKIAFPFDTSLRLNASGLPEDLVTLKQRAIEQEAANPSNNNYREIATGTTVNLDNGIFSGADEKWPSGSSFDTVVYYRFSNWNPANGVKWNVTLPCADGSLKGVLVIENGNYDVGGSRGGFNGTIVVWGGINPSTNLPYPDRGTFSSSGTSCVTGYATSSGNMSISGTYNAGAIPGVSDIAAFAGGVKMISWRELYG